MGTLNCFYIKMGRWNWYELSVNMGLNLREVKWWLEGGGFFFKKNHHRLRRHFSRCLHFVRISFLLLRVMDGSASDMRVFSVKQSWQRWDSLEYGGADLRSVHVVVCGMSFSFKFQIC